MKDKSKSNSISDSEAKILHVLWKKSPLDGKQIAQKLNSETWSYVTIKTLINRLLNKGFLSFEKQGRRYLYQTTISKKDYLKTENKQFLDRIYGGSLSGLFASFSEHEKINKKELEEIKSIISQMENEE
jgi:BlaI family penicillinase repressor